MLHQYYLIFNKKLFYNYATYTLSHTHTEKIRVHVIIFRIIIEKTLKINSRITPLFRTQKELLLTHSRGIL